jgi:hypothetical protein
VHDDQARELSDQELIELRGGISEVTGALMRAWWLGMVTARNPEEQRLFDEIVATVGDPADRRQEGDATPLGIQIESTEDGQSQPEDDELIPISDDEYLKIIGPLLTRYKMLRAAYLQGMITASTPDQERQLAELRELLD